MPNEITISLDVWNTLVQFNPMVRVARTEKVASYLPVSTDTIDNTYQEMKQSADRDALLGICRNQELIYREFITRCGLDDSKYQWDKVRDCVECAFIKHPPFIHPGLPTALKHIDKYSGTNVHFGIASNNNFINSDIIYQTVIRHLGVYFEFQIGSTDVECAKPSIDFINHVADRSPADIIYHIGDNVVCDNFNVYNSHDKQKQFTSIIIANPSECVGVLNSRSWGW